MTSTTKRRLISLVAASAMVATLAVTIAPSAALAGNPSYHNGFEKEADVSSPASTDTEDMFNVTRVEKTKEFHPRAGRWFAIAGLDAYAFSRLGGYSSTFPTGGYTTSVDVYLDMSTSVGTDLRFDWSSAVSDTSGAHRRDFIFHVGTNPAVPGEFVASVSNNAPGDPANPARNPITISESGWYTLQHEFKNVGGVLSVDMNVLDADGTELATWTLSDPSDLIGQTVGGNRYAWLVTNDFVGLKLDNVTRVRN